MRILTCLLLASLALPLPAATPDWPQLRAEVSALGQLTRSPEIYPAEGLAADGALRPLFFAGLPWKGKPTRVFAWIGLPAKSAGKIPGVVLVHGGGGTAFKDWVRKWNEHGFAAIAIAVEGQTDVPLAAPDRGKNEFWQRHAWSGPARNGIYGDSGEPLADQWMFHAVADTVLANSLLRAQPGVDAAHVGVMGISWGGVITSTVIGLDPRFAFAVPTYGCGHLADAANQYGRALGGNALYHEVWDPMRWLGRARLPVLWLSWPEDQHFPLDCQAACYRAAPGPHLVALIPGLKHSHPAGWNPPDSYAFAEGIVREGRPWLRQTRITQREGRVEVDFVSARPLERATLVSTTDRGFTGARKWGQTPAELAPAADGYVVHAELPAGTTAWFVNVNAGPLTGSSDFQERPAEK
jgi:dienelactone hydrolase